MGNCGGKKDTQPPKMEQPMQSIPLTKPKEKKQPDLKVVAEDIDEEIVSPPNEEEQPPQNFAKQLESKQEASEPYVQEKRHSEFQAYCEPQPIELTIIGREALDTDWTKFQTKVERVLAEADEEFDSLILKDFWGLKASQYNYILGEVKLRLADRDLLCFTMDTCRFSSAAEAERIDIDLVLQLCEKAYHFSIINCRLAQQKTKVQELVKQLAVTTASLSELRLQSGDILTVTTIEQLLEAGYYNSQMHHLTKLDLFDMEGLQDEPQILIQFIEYLQKMSKLQELGVENCLLEGRELEKLSIGIQEAPFLRTLRKLNYSKNKLDTQESLNEVVKLIANAPKFEEMSAKGTGYAITSNHEVKVRVTDKDNHVIDSEPILRMKRVFN